MNVFISWSGKQSQAIAEALSGWLPKVINAINPWVSSHMESGVQWITEVATQLETASAGIICLTPMNLHSDWILFEAGALSKALQTKAHQKPLVCPFLVGIEPKDLGMPLSQFQCTQAHREDVLRLLTTLNKAMGDNALSLDHLREAFNVWWPKLEEQLNNLPQQSPEIENFRVETQVLSPNKDFEVAQKAVLEAQERILVVSNYTFPQRPNPDATDARQKYYEILWKRVSESKRIEYRRIVQLPNRHADTMKYNAPFVSHLRDCIQARDRKSAPANNISVFWCGKWQQLTSFLVIDHTMVFIEFYIVIELPDGEKCSQFDRSLVITDHTGEAPRVFARMFNDLMTYSFPIEIDDVIEFEKLLMGATPAEGSRNAGAI